MVESLLFMSLNLGLGEITGFPRRWVRSAYWAFHFLRKESTMTITFHFYFMEMVLMWNVVQPNLDNTFELCSSLSLSGTACSASYLFCKGTWDSGIIPQETCLLGWTGTWCRCPPFSMSLCLARQWASVHYCMPHSPASQIILRGKDSAHHFYSYSAQVPHFLPLEIS